jgi:hypothetical protein
MVLAFPAGKITVIEHPEGFDWTMFAYF